MLQRHLRQHRPEDKHEHLRTSYSTTDRECLSGPNKVTADTLVKRMKADTVKMILKMWILGTFYFWVKKPTSKYAKDVMCQQTC